MQRKLHGIYSRDKQGKSEEDSRNNKNNRGPANYFSGNRSNSREIKQQVKRMDKLFWSIWQSIIKNNTTSGEKAFEMDTEQVQSNVHKGGDKQTVIHRK